MELEKLWQYQQLDMEVANYENAMRADPDRTKLLELQGKFKELQENSKRIETEVDNMKDRLAALEDEVKRLVNKLRELKAQYADTEGKDAEYITSGITQIQSTLALLSRYEQEIGGMRKAVTERVKNQNDIHLRAAMTKTEFDKLKVPYDAKRIEQKKKLVELRAAADKELAGLDPKLLETYNNIRKHTLPPIARLTHGTCSGCHMSVPLAVTRDMAAGNTIVTCDNCGRILYQQEN